MTAPVDADVEMRDRALAVAIYEVFRRVRHEEQQNEQTAMLAILAELRRRGAFLPGDPITDEMVRAACGALLRDIAHGPPENATHGPAHRAITAAMAVRKQP